MVQTPAGDNLNFWDEISDIGTTSDVEHEDGYYYTKQGAECNQGSVFMDDSGAADPPMYVSKSLLQSRMSKYECALSVIDEVSVISTPSHSDEEDDRDLNTPVSI